MPRFCQTDGSSFRTLFKLLKLSSFSISVIKYIWIRCMRSFVFKHIPIFNCSNTGASIRLQDRLRPYHCRCILGPWHLGLRYLLYHWIVCFVFRSCENHLKALTLYPPTNTAFWWGVFAFNFVLSFEDSISLLSTLQQHQQPPGLQQGVFRNL